MRRLVTRHVTSKSWVTQSGRVREGKPIDKSLICKMLNNRVYLGEIKHKDQWYKGEHTPIIDRNPVLTAGFLPLFWRNVGAYPPPAPDSQK